jgi:hypothetical protein
VTVVVVVVPVFVVAVEVVAVVVEVASGSYTHLTRHDAPGKQ